MSCAWLENSELRNCPVEEAFFYPLKLYKLRWSIETNYYEHKTFWSIDKYMVRKHIGIERLLNMINIAHSMTKILPYIDNMFYEYRNMSAQEFRHKLNELINKEIFFGSLGTISQKFRYHHGVLGSYGLESGLCSIKVVKCCKIKTPSWAVRDSTAQEGVFFAPSMGALKRGKVPDQFARLLLFVFLFVPFIQNSFHLCD